MIKIYFSLRGPENFNQEWPKSPTNNTELKFKTLDITNPNKEIPDKLKPTIHFIQETLDGNPEKIKSMIGNFSEILKKIVHDPQSHQKLTDLIRFHTWEKNIQLIAKAQDGTLDTEIAKREYKQNIIKSTMLELDLLSQSMLA